MTTNHWNSEYEALTSACGVVSLTNWTQVDLAGADRVKFLHNMCTNDLRNLDTGHLREAFCTDVKGKILAHVLIVAETNRLTLLTVPGQAERIIKHLDRYIIREDVTLTDVTSDFSWQMVLGPQAHEISVAEDWLIAKCDLVWLGGYLVRTQPSGRSAFGSLPWLDADSVAWNAVRVESGLPLYGVDFDESTLPQEINRDVQAISFTKGCYLGQETVARIDALGHVNKKLVVVRFVGQQVPPSGTKLLQGEQEVGTVTTSSWSPRANAPLAIAWARRGSNDVGMQLQSAFGVGEVIAPATIAS